MKAFGLMARLLVLAAAAWQGGARLPGSTVLAYSKEAPEPDRAGAIANCRKSLLIQNAETSGAALCEDWLSRAD